MNKVQELQRQNDKLKQIVAKLHTPDIKYYSHSRLKRLTYERSLRDIDWSLNNHASEIRATTVLCECGRCEGYLLDWPERSFQIWQGRPGACPYQVMFQLRRISFHRCEDIDPFILQKLLKVSRG